MAKRFVRSPQKEIWEGIADKSVYNDSLVFIEDAKEIWSNGVAYKPDFYYIEGTGSTAGTWLGSHVGITEYYPGLTIAYKVPVAGATTTTLKINSLAAVTVVKNSTTAISTAFPVGSIVILTYTLDGTTAYWKIADQNSTYSNASLGNGYTTCTTAADTTAKTASLSSYSLSTGGAVSVRFNNGITVANPTLNINSNGAKAIYYKGAALTDTSLIGAGDIVTFVYSTLYHIISIVKADLTVLLTGDVVGNVTADLNKETITIETSLSDTVKDRLSTIELVDSASLNNLNLRIIDLEDNLIDVDLSEYATVSQLSEYLPLTGGTLSGDLVIQRGESALSLSNCKLYFNNGGIGCDDPTSVNFYGFESSLSFGEDGYSSWTSLVSKIYSDELTIGGINSSEAVLYLGHELNNIISTTDQDSALSIWSAESISLSADGDGIYLNAPSVGFGEIMDISQSQVTLYNDTRLDFNAKSGTTTMGPTENGFIISNDSELKLTGDTVCVNAADLLEMYAGGIALNNVYINSSSEIVFDDNGTKLTQEELNFAYDCGAIKMEEDDVMRIYGEGGIRLDSPVTCISDISATAFYETSDARKKDIKEDLSLDKCYDLIDKCQTVIYSLKDQTKEQVGMIAQEIEEFFPEVVATDEEGFKSLAYDRLVVICFKVLKDVIKRLEKLENNGSN